MKDGLTRAVGHESRVRKFGFCSFAYVAGCDWISLNSLGFIKIRLFRFHV